MKKTYLVLAIILIAGALLRFYKLGQIPAGLHRDEAFLGYNAYSILKTGRDMSGNFLPLHLKSFIYSPAGFSYFSIPPIALFGLSPFSVRFASALFGALTIPLVYFLTLELFKKSPVALLSAGLLAASPWHINLSRTSTENIIVTFFILLGTLLHLKKRLLLSFLSFSLTLTLYQAPRAFLPLFIPLLNFVYRTRYTKQALLLYCIAILIPIIAIVMSPQLSLRIRTVSLFANQDTQLSVDEYIREDGVSGISRLGSRMFHNKLASYSLEFLQNYASHFSYDFLFTDKGLPDRYRVPNQGLLYLVEIPLILFGLIQLLKYPNKQGNLLLGWLLLAPIGSSLAFDDIPNLQRTVFMQPVLSIMSAIGVLEVFNYFKSLSKAFQKAGIVVGTAICLYSFAFFIHQYFIHIPIHKPWYRHEGYEQLVTEVNKLLPSYQKAIITNRESAPAIFFLFFGKYDPITYLKETEGKGIHDYDRANFGSYEFSQEECPLRLDTKTGQLTGQLGGLYVNYGTCNTPKGTRELQAIRRGDQSVVFRVVTP